MMSGDSAPQDSLTTAERYLQRVARLREEQSPLNTPLTQGQLAAQIERFRQDLNAYLTSITAGFKAVLCSHYEATRPLRDVLAPGELLGDLLRTRGYEGQDEMERARAAERLTQRYFSPRRVFYKARWENGGVGEEFGRRARQMGKGFTKTWTDLVIVPVLDAVACLPVGDDRTSTMVGVYAWMRCRVRVAVEMDLFGHTTDSRLREVLTEPEPTLPDDVLEVADLRVDVLLALKRLPPDVANLIFQHDLLGVDGATLARRYGLRPATVRQRLSRGRKNLRKISR